MKIKHTLSGSLMAALLLFGVSAFAQVNDDARNDSGDDSRAGAVFVGTNHNNTKATNRNEPANQVAMYRRAPNGRLSLIDYFNTGGQGSGPSKRFAGDGLGSAHSVQLSQDHRFLFVVNAGSNTLSVFEVKKNSLKRVDVVPTGDGSPSHRFPNSVAQHGNLVYVLNAADEGSITGFTLSNKGKLTPIPRSTRILDANQGCSEPLLGCPPDTLFNPTQVSFTPDGRQLVVTIKDGPAAGVLPGIIPTGPGRVLVFDVRNNDRPSQNYRQTNLNNLGPFGFSFDRNDNMLIALFVGGRFVTGVGPAAGAGSYRINNNGVLTTLSEVKIDQFDTCWLENNGTYAFGASYTSGTIASFRILNNGRLRVLDSDAGVTNDLPYTAPCVPGAATNRQGSTPLDIRVSPDGNFVYDVLPGSGKVAGWRINDDGSLTKIGEFGGLPKTVCGDQAPEERFGSGGSPAGIDVL